MSAFTDLLPVLPMIALAAILGATASGLIAPYIVVKKLNMLTGTLAHALVAPIGLSLWLSYKFPGFPLSPTTFLIATSIGFSLFISHAHLHRRQQKDALMSLLWSSGMATGLVFLAKTPGSNVDFNDFLLGSLIWLDSKQMLLLIMINVVTITCILLFYKQFLLICLDEEQAIIAKVPYKRLYTLLLLLISLVIVVLMQTIGLLLSMTLLTMPALIARCYSKNFMELQIYSCITSICMCLLGIMTAALFDLPIAPASALVGTGAYGLSLLLGRGS